MSVTVIPLINILQNIYTQISLLFRLLKFETMNIVGTSLAVTIQFTLFKLFALNPLIGNVIGSAFAFPINYYIQMRVVWKIRITDDVPKG